LRGEQGLATTELALLFPVVIAIVLGIVQAALWAHANAVAQAAAEYGAEIAAAYDSDEQAGETAALEFLGQANAIRDGRAQAVIDTTSQRVTVIVTASYPSVFGSLGVSASSTTVLERLPEP
jgi:Flp pilus assembly protein TadG